MPLLDILSWLGQHLWWAMGRASSFCCSLTFDQWIYLLVGCVVFGFVMLRGFTDPRR